VIDGCGIGSGVEGVSWRELQQKHSRDEIPIKPKNSNKKWAVSSTSLLKNMIKGSFQTTKGHYQKLVLFC
jgi:hypothetical protein